MWFFIGLGAGGATMVAALLLWREWTSAEYTRFFRIRPGKGTWTARRPIIETALKFLIREYEELSIKVEELEREAASTSCLASGIIEELEDVLGERRQIKRKVAYACKLVALRESKARALDLLAWNHQHLKPQGIRRSRVIVVS